MGQSHSSRRPQATEKQFLDAIAGKDENYIAEYRIIVVAKIERDTDSRAIRLVGAHIDITDRMLVQETLRESEGAGSALSACRRRVALAVV